MKTTVLHDEHGHIIGVSKTGDINQAGSRFVRAVHGQKLVDIELPPELERLQLRDLHKNYRFDIRTSHLVRKSGDEV